MPSSSTTPLPPAPRDNAQSPRCDGVTTRENGDISRRQKREGLFAASPCLRDGVHLVRSARCRFLSLSLSLSLSFVLLFQSSLLNLCVERANRRYRLSISLHLAHVHSICGNISDCLPAGRPAATTSRRPLAKLFKYFIPNQAEINRIRTGR